MAGYHRFVAYIYEYVNGRKSRNTGFAKVESRNGICRLQIHMQDVMPKEGRLDIFGFVREPGGLPAVPLGQCQVQGTTVDRKLTTPVETVGGSKYSFDQMAGIWIRSENGRNWATVFDDEPLEMSLLGYEEKAAGTKQISENQEKRTAEETMQPEAEVPVEEVTQPEAEVPAERITQPEAEVPVEEVTQPEAEAAAEEVTQPEAEVAEEEITQPKAEVAEEEITQPKAEVPVEEVTQPEAEVPVEEITQPKAEVPVEEITQPKAEVPAEGITQPEAELAEEETAQPEAEAAAKEDTASDKKRSAGEIIQRKKKSVRSRKPCEDKRWNCVTARYPHFQPTADGSIEDAIRIQPVDLRTLWQKGWKQGSNSFLMHGYYQYHYLMLGRCHDGRYLLGVPGFYDEQQEYMAKMFGFPEFIPAGGMQGEKRFGYWCRTMNEKQA